ncbi:copper chaperone PCu(A)C [Sulfitobacter aestuarii]|uniref:Copper chaperone PCu(A)C n=1 Tax=Sulfitobacter aestuarii TaxID=2161676 RepID=A0ABW5U4S1_9RHOB
MTITRFTSAALTGLILTVAPALAEGFVAHDAYVRASTPTATSAAAFMKLENRSGSEDRLIAVASDIAERVELHSHSEDSNGIMRMGEIENGVTLPAGETHVFARGGDHLMFMGVSEPLEQGGEISVTLTFEQAGDVHLQIPIDHERKPDHRAMSH